MAIKWDEDTPVAVKRKIKWDEDTASVDTAVKSTSRPSFTSPMEIGQILSGNIPQAISSRMSREAIADPRQGASRFMNLLGAVGTATSPVGTALATGTTKLLETPIGRKATEISKGYVEKIPQQLLGFPEPTLGAVGAVGEIARKTTPEQYSLLPQMGLGALAFKTGGGLDAKYQKWTTNYLGRLGTGNHEEIIKIPQDAKDIARSYIDTIKNDIKTFRTETAAVPTDYRQINKNLYNLYEGSGKAERAIGKEIIPKSVMDDLGNIAKEETPKSNLGFIYKIKDVISKNVKWSQQAPFTPDQAKLREAYFAFDDLTKDTLKNTAGFGDDAVAQLDAMNSVATEAYDLSQSVNKMVKGISKGIPAPEKILSAGPGTEKWQILKQISELEPRMASVMDKISRLRKTKEVKSLLKHVGLEAAQGVGLGAIVRGLGR